MPSIFKPLTQQQAIELVRESMAFKGDFAQWLEDEITYALNTEIFSAELYAVKIPAELRMTLSGKDLSTALRFGDSIKGVRRQGSNGFRLKESSDCALVLVTDSAAKRPWEVNLSLTSSEEGEIVGLHEAGDDGDQPHKRIFIWRFKVIKHCPMVGWYDPKQLARTAVDVIVSTLFGRHADYRLMEALVSSASADPHDYTRAWKEGPEGRDIPDHEGELKTDLWLDYVGDVGDGWNSTYAIAHCLAQPELEVVNPFDGGSCKTKRGEILVFGGDQVYPVASREQYRERLAEPYETALCRSISPHPHAYAIPGNHDWYDSLVAFTRLFCQKRWFGGWQTNQNRSYFALKLPGKWWLLGTDVQLDSDVDVQQVAFFKAVANKMEDGDKVIICTAEPHWVYATLYGKDDSNYNENNLAFLEKKVIGDKAKVAVFIAGDEHHYARYEGSDGTQKITAGGGGAFLHPTHGRAVTRLAGGFNLKANFPKPQVSRKLGWKNFLFLGLNPWFGVLTGSLYVLTAWSAKSNVGQYGLIEWRQAVFMALTTSLQSPAAVFWILAMVGGFILFTDTHSTAYRWIAGPLHGFAHLLATFFIGWFAGYIALQVFNWPFDTWQQLLFSAVILFVLGWTVGSTIVGIYLFVSLNLFGRHANEAFSSLAIPDYKNFLRLRIEANGDLTIFPIGLRRVPRRWRREKEPCNGPTYSPNDGRASSPELVELPIYFKIAGTPGGKIAVSSSAERCVSSD